MSTISGLNIFFAYARENFSLRDRLDKHLSSLKRNQYIKTWFDGKIEPGQEWEKSIFLALESADLILLLISADFIASDYCYGVELKKAIERHEKGEAIVIPIILTHCDWSDTPFAKIQALPKDAIPVMDKRWDTEDQAMKDVALGIRGIVARKVKEREEKVLEYFQEIAFLKEEKERLAIELKYSKEKQNELESMIKNNSESKLLKTISEQEIDIRKKDITIYELKKSLSKYEKEGGGSSLKDTKQKVKILSTGGVYSSINESTKHRELWVNDEIKQRAGDNEWKKTGFYPKSGMVGEVVDGFNHLDTGKLIYVILIDDKYYVPINADSVELLK